jgi:hypothetical protein
MAAASNKEFERRLCGTAPAAHHDMTLRPWLIALPLALLACESPTGPDARGQLETARALWQAHGGAWYTFRLSRECFCVLAGRQIELSVENGSVVWAQFVDSKSPVENAWFAYLQTVPDLFDLIDDAITRKAASLAVTYDPIYGYPTKISVDYSATVADDEETYTASDLSLGQAQRRP